MAPIAPAHGFDTLAHARRLKEAGVDETQAEAHAEAVRGAVTEGVATKADLNAAIADLKADLKAEIAGTKADITRIEDKMATKADLYRALWIQAGAIVAAIAALAGIAFALAGLIAGAGQPAP